MRLLHVDDSPVVVAVSGTVFAARASSEAVAREGIARMRFAVGVDDDLTEFYERFADDPVIGRAVRARPWLRVRRHPEPWEALMWAITEQLIDMPRAIAIQRRMIARFGRRHGVWRDSPSAAVDRRLRARGARGLRAGARKRALADAPRRAREVARGPRRRGSRRPTSRGCWRSPRSGRGRSRCSPCTASGAWTSCPAGDLGYLKLVGRLTTGNPKAIADEAEVRGFFAPYAPWAGLAASHLIRARTRPNPRPARTRWSAAAPRSAAA